MIAEVGVICQNTHIFSVQGFEVIMSYGRARVYCRMVRLSYVVALAVTFMQTCPHAC